MIPDIIGFRRSSELHVSYHFRSGTMLDLICSKTSDGGVTAMPITLQEEGELTFDIPSLSSIAWNHLDIRFSIAFSDSPRL